MPNVPGQVAVGPFNLHGITLKNNHHLPPCSQVISQVLNHKRNPQDSSQVSHSASGTEV